MARTSITKTTAPGAYIAAMADITFEAADTVNQNQVQLTGNEILIARNTDSVQHSVTITSVADARGRTKDISSQNLAAEAIKMWGPAQLHGWQQSDGMLYFEADDITIEFAVIAL